MTSRPQAVAFDAADVPAAAAFWAGLLDRDVLVESGDALVPGDETQVGLRFVASHSEQIGPRRLHPHLTSNSLEDQQRAVETVLREGGHHIEVGQESGAPFVCSPTRTAMNCV